MSKEYDREHFCKLIATLQTKRDIIHREYIEKDEQLKKEMMLAIKNLTRLSKEE